MTRLKTSVGSIRKKLNNANQNLNKTYLSQSLEVYPNINYHKSKCTLLDLDHVSNYIDCIYNSNSYATFIKINLFVLKILREMQS